MTEPPELCMLFLDVGQGDATIVLPPEGGPIVFDFGRDGWEVVQQLKAYDVERLQAVIASHLDIDHIGGMATLLDAYRGRVETVYLAQDRDVLPETTGNKAAKELTDLVFEGDGKSWDLVTVQRDGRAVASGTGWAIHLLAPRASTQQRVHRTGKWDEPNRYSAVLRVEMGGTAVLIGGDAPLQTWAAMPQDELQAKVFRTPHHGGALSDGTPPQGWTIQTLCDAWTAETLYDAIGPNVAVVSVGTNNRHGHPETEQWLRPLIGRDGCHLMCTQVTERCHPPFARGDDPEQETRIRAIREARDRWVPRPYSGSAHFAEPLWRHYTPRKDGQLLAPRSDRLEVPCAGTISVRIDAAGEVRVDPSPADASFDARIRAWGAALCRP